MDSGYATGDVGLVRVSFNKTFSTPPVVIATVRSSDAAANNKVVAIRSIQSTYFEAKVTNGSDGSNSSIGFNWIAIGG